MTTSESSLAGPGDYELKIDSQVEKFVETKQKLTYFLISASAAVTGFIAKFVIDNFSRDGNTTASPSQLRLVILSSIAGVFTSGFSLLNLHEEHRSYGRHLRYRYERKTWATLSPEQQTAWDKVNVSARRYLQAALVSLFAQILLAVGFFVAVFWR